MPRTFDPRKIKVHWIYTPYEAAEALGAHRQTILRWIADDGLHADESVRPWLIRGADLKAFLIARRDRRKQTLALHHLWCFRCRAPRAPAQWMADYRQETDTTGRVIALCPECCTVMNKIVRRSDLEAIRAKIDVTIQQADPRLVSRASPHLNVDNEAGAGTHATAHP